MLDFEIPSDLSRAEFVRARFHLEFQDDYTMSSEAALRLRRDLRRAGRVLMEENQGKERFTFLFDPPPSSDPVARKQFQKPGPFFVLHPLQDLPRALDPGDGIELQVTFWGGGMQGFGDFVLILQELGRIGIHKGEGTFDLIQIDAADPCGLWQPLWHQGDSLKSLAPPVADCRWHLQNLEPAGDRIRLRFLTPARILSAGRPLFAPEFSSLFPFILRRVSSVLHACCALETVYDAVSLLESVREDRVKQNDLRWQDWRMLAGQSHRQELGGVVGELHLETSGLERVIWVLALGALLGIGKGASYGNGHYDLEFLPIQPCPFCQ